MRTTVTAQMTTEVSCSMSSTELVDKMHFNFAGELVKQSNSDTGDIIISRGNSL